MKLFIKKSDCTFRDSLNGEVLEIETTEPIFFQDKHDWFLTPTDYDADGFDATGTHLVPYVCTAPKDYKL